MKNETGDGVTQTYHILGEQPLGVCVGKGKALTRKSSKTDGVVEEDRG